VNNTDSASENIRIEAPVSEEFARILTPEALQFIARLQGEFGERRRELLEQRRQRQAALDAGERPRFLAETEPLRSDPDWHVASIPPDLQKRWVEITGPTERKMLINALNSGASTFMADFEDANSPTWNNMVEGQINLCDAVRRQIHFTSPDGKEYQLDEQTAVLMVRPRGWHLDERHMLVGGEPVSGSLFDFGLYFFHNARELIERGSGPYFYLPKLESHLEARLWNDVFIYAQEALEIPVGTIRATVLIETILAAYEMEEILYELRQHSAGLNAGRWDYIFSIIKFFRQHPWSVLPDRVQVTMTAPFMHAYTNLLVRTCHKRGAHAIGGMAAFIPSRKDAEVNAAALAKVTEDKEREVGSGFDGTWVAHPDLVPVAMEVFQRRLGDRPHQKERLREDVRVSEADLSTFNVPGGRITEAGVRLNINVGVLYLAAWLDGTGAAAIYNLMEDTATAEISRAQLWQWIHQPAAVLDDGRQLTEELYLQLAEEEMEKIRELVGEEAFEAGRYTQARQILDRLVLPAEFKEFLTLEAYDSL
jgi:malate synthase